MIAKTKAQSNPNNSQALRKPPLVAALLQVEKNSFDRAILLINAIATQSSEMPIFIITQIQDFDKRLQLVQQDATVILNDSTSPSHAIAVGKTVPAIV